MKMFWTKLKFEFFILTLVDGTWEDAFCEKHGVTVSLNGMKVRSGNQHSTVE
ncbi:MAG: hypothetical protein U9N54_07895 [candidate division Zixibacteria bacterium]|nr:hypothetical protein [candidate division Zixibacteria bacterium]